MLDQIRMRQTVEETGFCRFRQMKVVLSLKCQGFFRGIGFLVVPHMWVDRTQNIGEAPGAKQIFQPRHKVWYIVTLQSQTNIQSPLPAIRRGGDEFYISIHMVGTHSSIPINALRQRTMTGNSQAFESPLQCTLGIVIQRALRMFTQYGVQVGFVEGWGAPARTCRKPFSDKSGKALLRSHDKETRP